MHTVEQAKELWCPMVRGLAADHPTTCRCIADQCAMWRWDEYKADGQRAIVDDPNLGFGGKREVTKDVYIGVRGHCGLAPLQKN